MTARIREKCCVTEWRRRSEPLEVLRRGTVPVLLVTEQDEVARRVHLRMLRAVQLLELRFRQKEIHPTESDQRRLSDVEIFGHVKIFNNRRLGVEVQVLWPCAVEVGIFGVVGCGADVREEGAR